MGEYVKIEGLKELRRDLKKMDGALPKEIARINRQVVRAIAVPDAKRRAAARSNPRVGRKVLDSIKGTGSQTRAQIVGGGARVPWFKGMEFGSNQVRRTARGGHTTQFPTRSPKRGRGLEGYFLYPAVYNNFPRIRDAYQDMLDALIRDSGLG